MLEVSNSANLFQNLEWEYNYPDCDSFGITMMGKTTEQQQQGGCPNVDNFNLFDSSCGVISCYPVLQDHGIVGGRGESPPLSASGSGDDHDHHRQPGAAVLAEKRLNHNASERDRRKKINGLYSSLRSLLPAGDHTKKLSIPTTVGRVVKYIPELEREVEDLSHKKEEVLSKISALLGDGQGQRESLSFEKEIKQRKKAKITEEMTKSSISIEKVEQREIVIHISTSRRSTSLPELLFLLEKLGLVVIDVSSFQSFGGRLFCNLHLAVEGSNIVKYEMLKEELLTLIEKHN